jgi:hypothetical protein
MGLTELLVSVLAANALAHYWHGPGTLFPFIGFAVVCS